MVAAEADHGGRQGVVLDGGTESSPAGGGGRAALLAEIDQRLQVAEFLHDDVLQMLGATLLKLEICQRLHALGRFDRALQELETLRTDIDGTIDRLRGLMLDLRPYRPREGALAAAIQSYAGQFSARQGILVEIEVTTAPLAPDEDRDLLAFRLIQELCALGRVGRVTRLRGSIAFGPGGVTLRAVYSGSDEAVEPLVPEQGLRVLRGRAALVGGTVSSESGGPAELSLTVNLPWALSPA